MSKSSSNPAPSGAPAAKHKSKVVHYSLRPAKNIERKMMGEAFARLAPLCPLSKYRYIGFGSEFFNDFALYHETLGIREMRSIEHDVERVPRCEFNRPYKCIKVEPGTASDVLPRLKWEPRSIVWLDYLDRLKHSVLADIRFVVSAASSGSFLVWSVNSQPWGDGPNEERGQHVATAELPAHRIKKLRDSMSPTVVPAEWVKEPLAKWGLAVVYHKMIRAEIDRALSDRNSSAMPGHKLSFHQYFHFRYADGQRMLTVGGLLLNSADKRTLGARPFRDLPFVREGDDAMEIKPPILTGREVRHLSQRFPNNGNSTRPLKWLTPEELENFRQVYRYYPVYAESEL
jgi:hypothetical protein